MVISLACANFPNVFICFYVIIYCLIERILAINVNVIVFYFYDRKVVFYMPFSIFLIFTQQKISNKYLTKPPIQTQNWNLD